MVNSSGWARDETYQQPTRPAEDVEVLTKGLMNQHNQSDGTTVEPENNYNFNSDSNL